VAAESLGGSAHTRIGAGRGRGNNKGHFGRSLAYS